eukprot:02855.XXX_59031_59219_1 [CDS] Oithona nana genome sequencing.
MAMWRLTTIHSATKDSSYDGNDAFSQTNQHLSSIQESIYTVVVVHVTIRTILMPVVAVVVPA